MEPILSVRGMNKSFGATVALRNVDLDVYPGEIRGLIGENGSGKSSIIKLILGDNISYDGQLYIQNNLKISYVSQETSALKGLLSEYIKDNNIDETLFKTILIKMDFERKQFNKPIDSFSKGQKKKILIAKSVCEKANIYIWDEPLNYIDIFSRMQIEKLIEKYKLTMIFVEHDESFSNKISTKQLDLDINKKNSLFKT